MSTLDLRPVPALPRRLPAVVAMAAGGAAGTAAALAWGREALAWLAAGWDRWVVGGFLNALDTFFIC